MALLLTAVWVLCPGLADRQSGADTCEEHTGGVCPPPPRCKVLFTFHVLVEQVQPEGARNRLSSSRVLWHSALTQGPFLSRPQRSDKTFLKVTSIGSMTRNHPPARVL